MALCKFLEQPGDVAAAKVTREAYGAQGVIDGRPIAAVQKPMRLRIEATPLVLAFAMAAGNTGRSRRAGRQATRLPPCPR